MREMPEWMKWVKLVLEIAAIVLIVWSAVWILQTAGLAEEETRWILCRPADYINVRETPEKKGEEAGYLECGDEFKTDGKIRNGFIHVLNWGECGDGWVYNGYVVEEKPEQVFANYVCVARKQAVCRRWINGPKTQLAPMLKNGQECTVFYVADGWAVTSRGYVMAEWLELN